MTSLLGIVGPQRSPFQRLVDRRVAAGGKPLTSRAVDRRVAAVND